MQELQERKSMAQFKDRCRFLKEAHASVVTLTRTSVG